MPRSLQVCLHPLNVYNYFIVYIFIELCCNSIECWSFASRGLATVGQDEVFFCLDCNSFKPVSTDAESAKGANNLVLLNADEELLQFPRDVFRLFTAIYDSATKGTLECPIISLNILFTFFCSFVVL